METRLSAVVLNYRSAKDALKCVESLLKQTIISEMEILLADNHSNDESVGMLRAAYRKNAHVKIVEMPINRGFGGGNNQSITYAKGEYIFFINPDNTASERALETLLEYLMRHDSVGIVSPALQHPDGTIRPSARPFPRIRELVIKRLFPENWHKKFAASMRQGDAHEVDWVAGTGMLMRKDFFLALGGFDERFFLFFEDIDLCRRVHAASKKVIYLPSVKLLDRKERLSEGGLLSFFNKKTVRIHFRSSVKYFKKWAFTGPKSA